MLAKQCIIRLIQQDMYQQQMCAALTELGLLPPGCAALSLLPQLAVLMQVPQGRVYARWSTLYTAYMRSARTLPLSAGPQALYPMAALYYRCLKAVLA